VLWDCMNTGSIIMSSDMHHVHHAMHHVACCMFFSSQAVAAVAKTCLAAAVNAERVQHALCSMTYNWALTFRALVVKTPQQVLQKSSKNVLPSIKSKTKNARLGMAGGHPPAVTAHCAAGWVQTVGSYLGWLIDGAGVGLPSAFCWVYHDNRLKFTRLH